MTSKEDKTIETESRCSFQVKGGEGDRALLPNGYEVSIGNDENSQWKLGIELMRILWN